METEIVAALIGVAGTVAGAVFGHILPTTRLFHRLSSKTQHHSLLGSWVSSWGPLPDGPVEHHETLTVTKQRGDAVEGQITRDSAQPGRVWGFEGKYDGTFLQLIYYPAEKSEDRDFVSRGCYFLQRKADGSFEGVSTGYGDDYDDGTEAFTTEFHTLRRAGRFALTQKSV